MTTTERIAAIREALEAAQTAMEGAHAGPYSFLPGQLRDWRKKRASAIEHLATIEAEMSAEPVEIAHTDLSVVVEAGDNLDHKFIDLVAFCAANIPDSKLQDLVDDWAGHEERAAWTKATKHLRPNT